MEGFIEVNEISDFVSYIRSVSNIINKYVSWRDDYLFDQYFCFIYVYSLTLGQL